ncbi:MAG: DUF3828 domain-containing protein [Anaerolineae bacterium]|nr:DUF3828 domain-containing protein [Anaerolineae bacterium]
MKKWTLIAIGLVAVLGLAAWIGYPQLTGAAPANTTPSETVEAFYSWYIGLPMDQINTAYKDSDYLTEGFVQKVEQIRASFDRGGYDPILLAQDIPNEVKAVEETVSGDTALVRVETSFAGHSFLVELTQVGGEWRISDVRPAR